MLELVFYGLVGGFSLWVLFRFFDWRARMVRSLTRSNRDDRRWRHG